MASSQQILREYLVSLGYKIDTASERKFDTGLLKTKLNVTGLATTVLGVATAAQAMVAGFARSMEQMYYSSRRAESTVGNLQAVEFAARNIGLTGEGMRSAVEGMARAMRLNPGLQGLVESFGIKVTGRDKADVAIDLLDTLRKMPFYVSSQYAGLFGIGPDELLLLLEGLDKFKEMAALRKQMAKDAGEDAEAQAKVSVEYANQLREVEELFGILKRAAMTALLPTFREIAGVTKEVLKDWTEIFRTRSLQDFGDALKHATVGEGSWWDRFMKWGGAKSHKTFKVGGGEAPPAAGKASGAYAAVEGDPESLFNALETQYGLPMGLLDKMWAKESGRGKYMTSKAGARGHFQFMGPTAKQYGIEGQEDDLTASAGGAARMMRDLLNKYGGDKQLALAAYNWGAGNVDKFGLDRAPAETRDYVSSISGQPIIVKQETTINVGSVDPEAAGSRIASVQNGVNESMAALLRNQRGAVR